MKTMDDDEFERLKSLSANMLKQIEEEILRSQHFKASISSSVSIGGHISPTDLQAAGRYEYQEPEQDEQGTLYGYKVLYRKPDCDCTECSTFSSPRFPALWYNGELTSDREPCESSMYGIHFTKNSHHRELGEWFAPYPVGDLYGHRGEVISLLVRCALSGTVVETEQGFRAQHARITEVCINGHWQSYSDYQKRAGRNSGHYPKEADFNRWEWRDR